LIVGGGTVLDEDRQALAKIGIRGVFGPSSDSRDIIQFIRAHADTARRHHFIV
jgi:methylmalonyl-CoA mutase cobalamin-binding subunit